MSWFDKAPWTKPATVASVEALLGAILGRNPDPINLARYTALAGKWGGFRRMLSEARQNQEFVSHFGARGNVGPLDRPAVWNAEAYAAYVGETPVDRILVVKLDHIGDFILAQDSFWALRRAFPEAKIALLCGPWNAALARASGVFDRVETLDFFAATADASRPRFCADALGPLVREAFDLAIDFRVEADTRVVLDHLCAKHKCGYVSNACASVLTVGLPRPNYLHSDSLVLNQRMMLLALAHGVIDYFRRDPQSSGAALRQALIGDKRMELGLGAGRPLVVMHAFSGRAIKNWPFANFMEVAAWLERELDAQVVLLGTKSEALGAPSLTEDANAVGARSLVGETSLEEAIAIIAQADLYIGNDSGLTHVAARLDVPSLAIFSGVAPIENWAPFGKNLTILHAPVACAPCYLPSIELCSHARKCMSLIDVDFVYAEARRRLREEGVPP